jgi:hypothetical protein
MPGAASCKNKDTRRTLTNITSRSPSRQLATGGTVENLQMLDNGRAQLTTASSALIQATVVINAAWSAYCLRQEFPVTAGTDLGVMFAAYDLSSRYVRLPLSLPDTMTDDEKGLFPPPENEEGFHQLAERICGGELVRSFLR